MCAPPFSVHVKHILGLPHFTISNTLVLNLLITPAKEHSQGNIQIRVLVFLLV